MSIGSNKYIWLVPFVVVPLVVGGLIGWFVGASRTPVVGAILPLLFSFVGATAYGFVDRRVRSQGVVQELMELPDIRRLDEVTRGAIEHIVGASAARPDWLPLYSAVAAAIFCIACLGGSYLGGRARVPTLPSVKALLGNGTQATGAEMAHLYAAAFVLQKRGLNYAQVREIFETAFIPILKEDMRTATEKDLALITDGDLRKKLAPVVVHYERERLLAAAIKTISEGSAGSYTRGVPMD